MALRNVDVVRRLWAAFAEGGLLAAAEMADPDVEWVPYMAAGRVFRGPDEVREFVSELGESGQVMEAAPYSFEERGDAVVVSGHMRVRSPSGIADSQVHWVYRFDGGRLARVEAHPTRDEALRAVESEEEG